MEFFTNCDSDDYDYFIVTFFNVVRNIADKDHTVVTNIRVVVDRDRQAAYELLVRDYFIDNCLNNEATFGSRFCLNRALFLRIINDLEARYEYFMQKPDARGIISFSVIHKCVVVHVFMSFFTNNIFVNLPHMIFINCIWHMKRDIDY